MFFNFIIYKHKKHILILFKRMNSNELIDTNSSECFIENSKLYSIVTNKSEIIGRDKNTKKTNTALNDIFQKKIVSSNTNRPKNLPITKKKEIEGDRINHSVLTTISGPVTGNSDEVSSSSQNNQSNKIDDGVDDGVNDVNDTENIELQPVDTTNVPKKRGRRPKVVIAKELEEPKEPPEIKKRGRKPTCKILNKSDLNNIKRETMDECLIVQLPITKMDIDKIILDANKPKSQKDAKEDTVILNKSHTPHAKNSCKETIFSNDCLDLEDSQLRETSNFENRETTNKSKKSLNFEEKNIVIPETNIQYNIVDKCSKCEKLQNTIDEIETKYHIYKVSNYDKQIHNLSVKLEDYYTDLDLWTVNKFENICCWWCCHVFDTLPIGLPEKQNDNIFKVIGFFCSFECSLAYNLSLNDHKMWDRISLLYHLRNIIFKQIFPDYNPSIMNDIIAASPRNLLKMFGGSVTIEEYRKNSTLLKKQYRNIMPPIVSLVSQLEESTYSQEQNLIIKPVKSKHFDAKNTELVLKRNKPIANKSSLVTSMGIKYNQ
jgi:hypothetical protein